MSRTSYYKTTAADFKLFKATCLEWVEKFSLGQWHHNFEHCHLDVEGRCAQVAFTIGSRHTLFSLSKVWTVKPTKLEIKKAALHEVTHVLTARLYDFATARFVNKDEILEEFEAISRALEHAIYGQ
ncbi:hypothetical protein SYK_02790 [Pseudodesulfovibrio nedwellii]|uniref:SprT-like domain-containing protein n=1 Tax=Pseudodesulfovibrio nedwellii TaxID=2973072 RepID=A0ABM8AWX8_9BACT|nr:hypothetical protein [Pseudodesulfovibrio nedwellii]BDQ35919.1 hypothetical protein SYK_02790 [Pseudodesulfovibrio nedwellii]